MLRSIASRLLICAAVVMAAPVGAVAAPTGSGTAHVQGVDQVALGAAKPADGRLLPSTARKPEPTARLSVVLGIAGGAAAPSVPDWHALDSSRPAPSAPGRTLPSCKTSRGPPYGSSALGS